MKAVTWLAAMTLNFAAVSSSAFANTPEGWITDIEAGVAQAKKENKAVLVEFTGSDWCPPCIVMRKTVFSKKEFVEKASKDYVLVEIDIPNSNKELAARNQIIAEKYKVEGFPMVVLLDNNGKEFTRFFAADYPETEKFLSHLKDSLRKKRG